MNLNAPLDPNSLNTGDASGDDSAMVTSPEGNSHCCGLCVDKENETIGEWISRMRSELSADQVSGSLGTSRYIKALPILIEEIKKGHSLQIKLDVLI